ncbi:MAG: hypothetical protein BZY88_04330 [SAR202 cluster bacterium Io17-Chloro-G9]|nr:MAG: hypothetical protein BZY88_04330 [SAR202 cluster bacterium Io17-Chloro-G9]
MLLRTGIGRLTRPLTGSLRTKLIAWFFVPTAIILVAVALVNFNSYQNVTEDLVIEKDRDLTQLWAGQLSTNLDRFPKVLSEVSHTLGISKQSDAHVQASLGSASPQLRIFDGGVIVLDTFGTVTAIHPLRPEIVGQDWSGRALSLQMLRSPEPIFSDVLYDGSQETEVIEVAVPIIGDQGEFLGSMVGVFHLGATSISAFYSGIVRLRIGNGSSYIVDGTGKVLYHDNQDQVGADFSMHQPVTQMLLGEAGAIRHRDQQGADQVSAFAPIPGTPWGLVTEESWSSLTSGSRNTQRYLLLLLALGVIVPAIVVAIGLKRVMRPIKALTQGAQRIAEGDFEHAITASSGDEIQTLARQFNMMADALKESYAGLERNVEARTEELREANQTLTALIEASPLAIGVLNQDRKLRSWNKAGERIFGWTEAEALSQPYPLLAAEEDRDEALDRQRRILAGESLLGLELHHRKKDGSPVDVEVWAAPLRDGRGEISGGVVIYADITERNEAQEALLQAEEKYRSIFENSVEGIFQLSPEGEIIAGNPALAQIFGVEFPEDITASQLDEQLDPPERSYFHELGRLIREGGSVLGYEVEEFRQDGTPIWVSISARAVYSQQGELDYYEGTVQDITEHKLAEEELRQSEERFRNLVETAQDIIYTVSVDGILTSLNPAFETISGWSRFEWLGRPADDLIHPDDLDLAGDLLQRSSAQPPETQRFERRLLTKSGAYLNCEFLTTLLVRDGTAIGIVGIGRDVTERKEAEQTLLEQTRELAVLEERNRFAREIHDTLAQGFTGIVLQLEAAEQVLGTGAPEVQDHMSRAKGLARDSLQEARRSVWDLLPQALEQLPLDTAIEEEVRRRFDGKGSFSVSGEQRPLNSSVQTALLRICQEALANVSRHAAATKVSVNMTFNTGAIHLEVRDNGIGFDQAETGDSRKEGGGFGLIGMEQRARQLGGTVLVTSEKGKGTVVEAQIPAA